MHITNKYIDLKPVLGRLAGETGMGPPVRRTGNVREITDPGSGKLVAPERCPHVDG